MDPLSSGHYLHFFHSVITSFIYYSMFFNTVFSCNLGCLFLVVMLLLLTLFFHFTLRWNEVSSHFAESLGPFVVVTLVGPADASWPLTPAGRHPQSCAAGNRIFPSLVLSILSLWDHGSQDVPLSQIDKQGLADPPDSSSACWLQPSGHFSFNAHVSCGDEGSKAVTPHRRVCPRACVCVYVYTCAYVCVKSH